MADEQIEHVDVVVVGAGIAGASLAWRLAPHARVALVEAEATAGSHATGRSAAMLNVTSGPLLVCQLAADSRPFLASPPEGFADHPLLGPRGLLWVGGAGTAAQLAALAAKAPGAVEVLDGDGARDLVPSLAAEAVAGGAVHEPGAMTIDVASLLAGYLRELRSAGGLVALESAAERLERRSDGWLIHAGHRRLACLTVVDAGGAWADAVAVRAGLRPVGLEARRRTAALAALPDLGFAGSAERGGGPFDDGGIAAWPMVMDVAGQWYAEPETGGLLISPADQTPCQPGDVRPDEIDVALAMERVSQALGVPLRSIRRAWAGLRTFAPDELPVVGPDPDDGSFFWLAGQGGAGIKTAPALAELVARSILDGAAVPTALAPDRLRH